MVHVGGDDHPAAGDLAAHQLGGQAFAEGDVLHLLRDHALPREVHLRDVCKAAPALDPFCAHGCFS